MNFRGVKIGLEVHCQLTNLRTKLFCSCSADYREKAPNTFICPICTGLPGSLPSPNEKAIEDAIMVALALDSEVSEKMAFFRKNYFYPDLPKNFQISQYDKAGGIPLAKGGYLRLSDGKRVHIRRIHLEEDPGKLSYEGTIASSPYTLVDYNRAGIALMEIVTEPDMKSPKEAREFLERLRSILEHLGVSDGGLEGSMRCDANISLAGGKRVEVKNISSSKEVERALSFEMARQRSLVGKGLQIRQETRHWDEVRRITVSLRTKEEEEDYRYFPEPDLVPMIITKEWVEKVRLTMPELPEVRRKRFMKHYGLSLQNAEVLTLSKDLANFFEECTKLYPKPMEISNWLVNEILAYLNERNIGLRDVKMTPLHLSKLLELIDEGAISRKTAQSILREVLSTGGMPDAIVKEEGLKKVVDVSYVEEIVDRVLKEHPEAVKDALEDEKAVHFLMGMLMRATGGRIDPALASEILRKKLSGIKKKPSLDEAV